jgi:hypothetical protein
VFPLKGSPIQVYCGATCKRRAAVKRRNAQKTVPLVKRCPICDTVLETIRGTVTYCSPECRRESDRRHDRARYEQAKRARREIPAIALSIAPTPLESQPRAYSAGE